jgi:hypothetical protein
MQGEWIDRVLTAESEPVSLWCLCVIHAHAHTSSAPTDHAINEHIFCVFFYRPLTIITKRMCAMRNVCMHMQNVHNCVLSSSFAVTWTLFWLDLVCVCLRCGFTRSAHNMCADWFSTHGVPARPSAVATLILCVERGALAFCLPSATCVFVTLLKYCDCLLDVHTPVPAWSLDVRITCSSFYLFYHFLLCRFLFSHVHSCSRHICEYFARFESE